MGIVDTFAGNGFVTAIPGVYTTKKTVAPGGSLIARGVLLAVSGTSFYRLKPATPVLVTSRNALRNALPVFGSRFQAAIFSPANDDNVPGGASAVYLVNAAPSTRASRNFEANATTQLTLRSRFYGAEANKIWVKIESGTNKGKKLTLGFEDATLVQDDVGGDDILGLRYTGSEASTVVATLTPATGVVITYTKTSAVTSGSATYNPDDMAFDGTITFTLNAAPGGGNTVTFTITGIEKDTGDSIVEEVDITAGDTVGVSTALFSSVTSIVASGTWGSAANATISGTAFSLPIATFDTVQDVIDAVNAKAAATFGATDAFGDASTRLITAMDYKTGSIKSATYVYHNADLDAIIQAIGNDEADVPIEPLWTDLVIAERGASGDRAPDNVTTAAYLAGGANGTADTDSWQAALDATRELKVNEGWAETTNSGVESQILTHVHYMQGQGGNHRHWHFASSSQPSKATVKAKVGTLNREWAQLWVNAVKALDENGKGRWFDPIYMALRGAAMYCGTSLQVMPLVRKHPDIIDIREGSDWTYANDGEEMVQASAVILAKSGQQSGFWIVNDVTTYRKERNSMLTQGSAVRSLDASAEDLSAALDYIVGLPGFDGNAEALVAEAKKRLAIQRKDLQLNNGFASVSLETLGTTWRINAEIHPVVPVLYVANVLTFSIPVKTFTAA